MKMNNIPDTHLFTEADLRLFDLNQIYQISTIWFAKGMRDHAGTFDLFIRDLPEKRNFFLFGGLEEIVSGILKWQYTDAEISFLLKNKIISPGFADYLKNFRFTCDIDAMPEGTVFFPNEPVLRITGPLIEVNLFTMFFINALVSNTIFLSKFIRIVMAAGNANVLSTVLRGHSFESAMKAARAEYIAGVRVISCPAFYRKYHLPVPMQPPLTTLYHAYFQSFEDELTAMRKGEEVFPGVILTMIDTFDYKKGLANAIRLGLELKAKGGNLSGIVIDSGDLSRIAKYARKKLDQAGLNKTQITLASNIDEYEIVKMNRKKVPVNSYIAVTEALTSSDAPKLEAVFKLAEVDDGRKVRPTIKLSTGKLSLPGKKQVFRKPGKIFSSDTIGFAGEKLGEPLLKPVFRKGKLVYSLPDLPGIREYVAVQIARLPERLKTINQKVSYPVNISRRLSRMIAELRIKRY